MEAKDRECHTINDYLITGKCMLQKTTLYELDKDDSFR